MNKSVRVKKIFNKSVSFELLEFIIDSFCGEEYTFDHFISTLI